MILVGLFHAYLGQTVISSLIATVFLFVLMLTMALMGGFGGGDVKMAAGLGAWFGWPWSIYVIGAAVVAALLVTIIKQIRNHTLRDHLKHIKQRVWALIVTRNIGAYKIQAAGQTETPMPFGAYMGLCAMIFIAVTSYPSQ